MVVKGEFVLGGIGGGIEGEVGDALEHEDIVHVAEGLGDDGGGVEGAGPVGLLGVVEGLVVGIDVAVVIHVRPRVPDGAVLGVGEAGGVGAGHERVVVHP